MSKHTPGPWIVVSRGMFSPKVVDANSLGICHTTYAPTGAEANARLIAAAPDLLEALKEIVDAADGAGWEQLDPSFKKARAAIAKATGEQP